MENLLYLLVGLVAVLLGLKGLKGNPKKYDDTVEEKKREKLDEQIQELGKALQKTDVKKEPIDVEEYWRKQ